MKSIRFAAAALLVAIAVQSPLRATELPELPPLPEIRPTTELRADTAGVIVFDSRSPFDFDLLLNHYAQTPVTSASGELFLPAGASAAAPVPAMVLLPGSGGIIKGRERETAQLLAAQGFAGIVIDYYSARGFTDQSPYRDKTSGVTEFDIVTDAYAALRALQNHPAIDGQRIGVMGFSYGGMATRLAMDARLRDVLGADLPRFAAHVDYYGPCFQDFGQQQTTGAPLLSLRGGLDGSNNLPDCAADEQRLRDAGSPVGSVIYANAGHSWDIDRPRKMNEFPYVNGCVVAYDERGFPSLNGQPMITADAPTSRAARHKLRLQSGRFFVGCLKFGYIVGRDEPVKRDTDAQLLAFLRRVMGQ